MSGADIYAGDCWENEIAKELQSKTFGIICVIPSNQTAPWLNFEVGAISKDLGEGGVVLYLHTLTIPNMISRPLRQFHAKVVLTPQQDGKAIEVELPLTSQGQSA